MIDLETTGTPEIRGNAICEFALVTTTMEAELHRASTFVDPCRPIPASAKAIHHITETDVAGAPKTFPFGVKAPKADCFVAHNAKFERAFLPQLARHRWLCTMRLARKVYPELDGYGNQFLRYELGVPVDMPPDALPHRALPDALVTASILRALLRNLPEDAPRDLNGLCSWASSPVVLRTCRFGNKYRGKPWKDVPRDYLEWMSQNATRVDEDTAYTVQHYLSLHGQ